MFKIKKLVASFKDAFNGLKVGFKVEQSFRVQVVCAAVVVFLMFYLPLSGLERAILFLAISFVLGLELLNSQLEDILDLMHQEYNVRVKKIKDLSAAAVLVSAMGAFIVGVLIFSKYLLQ